jgi:ribosomal protein S18 acetylase RimI-like enzyme
MNPEKFALSEGNNNPSALPIQKAGWRDVGAVMKLEKRCFSPDDAWPLLDVIAVLSTPDTVRFKIEFDNQMIAFAAAERQIPKAGRAEKSVGWITTISVIPEYRRQSLASRLLAACEEALQMPVIRLSVRRSNEDAIRLYQHAGYVQVDIWPDYYIGNEDALVLEKKFDARGKREYNINTMEILV